MITACGIKKRHNGFFGRYVFFYLVEFEKLSVARLDILNAYRLSKIITSVE